MYSMLFFVLPFLALPFVFHLKKKKKKGTIKMSSLTLGTWMDLRHNETCTTILGLNNPYLG